MHVTTLCAEMRYLWISLSLIVTLFSLTEHPDVLLFKSRLCPFSTRNTSIKSVSTPVSCFERSKIQMSVSRRAVLIVRSFKHIMLDRGRIHQGHEKEIRDVCTFTEQHVGAARRSIWRDVTLTLRTKQPSRFKHVTSIICYLCFMQYAWRCAFFFLTFSILTPNKIYYIIFIYIYIYIMQIYCSRHSANPKWCGDVC